MPKDKTILNPEVSKRNRLVALQEMVVDGQDAEAVYKYAYKFKKDVEQETLEALLKPNTDLREVANYYKVVCRFCDLLVKQANAGKRKEKTMGTLLED